jgi:hypothetical protein
MRFRPPALLIYADGRRELDIQAEITTEDGKKVAFYADGVVTRARRDTGVSAAGQRDADQQSPGVRVGESDANLGHRHGGRIEGRNTGEGIRCLKSSRDGHRFRADLHSSSLVSPSCDPCTRRVPPFGLSAVSCLSSRT